jgi:hypothetical protein
VDLLEDIHSHALAGDEAVPFNRIDGECSPYLNAFAFETSCKLVFQISLSGPTDFISGLPQISAGYQDNFV